MHKSLLTVLCSFLLTGCFMRNDSSVNYAAYEGFYKSVQDNDRFQDNSVYYSISAEMTTLADGTHRYYIFLDNAQIAMHDVVLLAVENDTNFEDATKMMPSIGIFESTDYSLIPNQSRVERGYVKGLVLSGESSEDTVDIHMLVEWRDKNKENAHREYLSFTIDQNGFNSGTAQTEEAEGQANE